MKFAAIVLIFISCMGCGDGRPPRVPVSGQVLIDGKPLTFGTIQFIPAGARASQGSIDKEGNFTLTCFDQGDGAVPGNLAVAVIAAEPIGSTKMRWHAPKKYADHRTSGLTHDLAGPDDRVVINLSWDGGKEFIEVLDVEPESSPFNSKK
jgi:hypothetical protein